MNTNHYDLLAYCGSLHFLRPTYQPPTGCLVKSCKKCTNYCPRLSLTPPAIPANLAWFLASLDRRLLMDMSRRAGYYGSVQADLTAWREHYEKRRRNMNGRIWGDQPERQGQTKYDQALLRQLAISNIWSTRYC